MTVKEIVREYLEENGFDGLYNVGECGCQNKDLMPCEEGSECCIAGHFIDNGLKDWDFIIGDKRWLT